VAPALKGCVRGADGTPLAGAVVAVASGPAPFPDIAQISGADGAFEIDVPEAGTYLVSVHGPDGTAAKVSLLAGDGDRPPVDVTLTG
jgi:hypothetical protein